MNELDVTTPSPTEIQMVRDFDAPRHLVIQAMTTPALLKRWLGNSRCEMVGAEVDFRVGGRYRHHFRARDGHEFAFSGTFDEIADDRMVQTEIFEGHPGSSRVTTTWVEHGGKTTMTIVMGFASQAIRDMVLATGMADGAGESYDGLDALLSS